MRLPYHRVSRHDQDDFVRNLLTVLDADPDLCREGANLTGGVAEIPLSPSVADREAVLTLDQIKSHCRIEPDQTEDDDYLKTLEMAAHVHTENALRRPGELDGAAPENVKLAMLILIAHWYRNREAVIAGIVNVAPYAYDALLSTEREYSGFY